MHKSSHDVEKPRFEGGAQSGLARYLSRPEAQFDIKEEMLTLLRGIS